MTVPEPPEAISANEPTLVEVTFIAPEGPERYSKRVLIQTDDPDMPLIILRLKAMVGMPLEAEPDVIELGQMPPGADREAEVGLINHGPEPVRLVYATSTSSECVLHVSRASVPPNGGHIGLPLSIAAGDSATGGRSVVVQVHTDCPAQPRIEVRVEYSVSDAPNGDEALEGLAPGGGEVQ